MSRFEADFLASMVAVDALVERTESAHQRAILENYRHVYLEVSGRIDEILSPETTVEHPRYRVCWAEKVAAEDVIAPARAAELLAPHIV